MTERLQTLNFVANSHNRNTELYPETHDFKIDLPETLNHVAGIELKYCIFPGMLNNVTPTNNTIYFNDGITEHTITIPVGYYTVDTFISAIESAMESAMSGIFGLIFSVSVDINNKLTMTSNINFEMKFSSTVNTISNQMGFSNVNTGMAKTHTSDNPINLNGTNVIYVRLVGTPTTFYDSNAEYNFFIPLEYKGFIPLFISLDNTYVKTHKKDKAMPMSSLHIQLYDIHGNLIDLQRGEIGLYFTIHYYPNIPRPNILFSK